MSKIWKRSYEGKINTNVNDDRIPKEGSYCIYLSEILIYSDLFCCCYPQVFLEECKYIAKEKKGIKYITDDLKISSDDSD